MRIFAALVLAFSNVFWIAAYAMWRRRAALWEQHALALRHIAKRWEEIARRAVRDRNEWSDLLLGKLEAYGDYGAIELRRRQREQTAIATTPPTTSVN